MVFFALEFFSKELAAFSANSRDVSISTELMVSFPEAVSDFIEVLN